MKANTTLMAELITVSEYEATPLYEVVATYSHDNDIDPEELIKMFDTDFIYKIKSSAAATNQRLKNIDTKLKRRRLF